eukprot:3645455-Pyramimonas_sp.AAC.1
MVGWRAPRTEAPWCGGAWAWWRHGGDVAGGVGRIRARHGGLGAPRTAVSYTHLRAHETGAYL